MKDWISDKIRPLLTPPPDLRAAEVAKLNDQIVWYKKQLEKLKEDSGINTLCRHNAKLCKENHSLHEEIIALRRGCDRVKILDNPVMRWIHRALREADEIKSARG